MLVTVYPSTKEELLHDLKEQGIHLNTYAEQLLDSEFYDYTCAKTYHLTIVTPTELGFTQPPNHPELFHHAQELCYELCPLELGPHFRMSWLTQPPSNNSVLSGQRKGPDSAVTVCSPVLSSDNYFPKGLYLRNVDGVLWLRGYICDDEYKVDLTDRFALVVP